MSLSDTYVYIWNGCHGVPSNHSVKLICNICLLNGPCFGVPKVLFSDRGTKLLSFLMKDICKLLGIEKLNTTTIHPQYIGAVKRFNRTLKSMLRIHAAKFGMQQDQYISGVVWAYRNTPHSSAGKKPSFLFFGFDCHFPMEVVFLLARAKLLRATY